MKHDAVNAKTDFFRLQWRKVETPPQNPTVSSSNELTRNAHRNLAYSNNYSELDRNETGERQYAGINETIYENM